MSESTREARDRLLRIVHGEFGVRRGHPLPYGATARREGVNFSVFSRHATDMSLVLFLPGDAEPRARAAARPALQPDRRRLARAACAGSTPASSTASAPRARSRRARTTLRFDPRTILIDPYSQAVAGLERWGEAQGVPNGRLERRARA